jgi:hypothetical protein
VASEVPDRPLEIVGVEARAEPDILAVLLGHEQQVALFMAE